MRQGAYWGIPSGAGVGMAATRAMVPLWASRLRFVRSIDIISLPMVMDKRPASACLWAVASAGHLSTTGARVGAGNGDGHCGAPTIELGPGLESLGRCWRGLSRFWHFPSNLAQVARSA